MRAKSSRCRCRRRGSRASSAGSRSHSAAADVAATVAADQLIKDQEEAAAAEEEEEAAEVEVPEALATLLDAINREATEELSELLQSEDAEVDTADSNGRTALMASCELGRAGCVALLLAAGADPCRTDGDGMMALHLACSEGQTECASLLIRLDPMEGHVPTTTSTRRAHRRCSSAAAAGTRRSHSCSSTRRRTSTSRPPTGARRSAAATMATSTASRCSWRMAPTRTRPMRTAERRSTRRACMGTSTARGGFSRRSQRLDSTDNDGATALYVSCWAGHAECVALLLENGANGGTRPRMVSRRCSRRLTMATPNAAGCCSPRESTRAYVARADAARARASSRPCRLYCDP